MRVVFTDLYKFLKNSVYKLYLAHMSKKCSTFASEFPVVPDASQTIGCRFYSTLAFKIGRKGTTFLRHIQIFVNNFLNLCK